MTSEQAAAIQDLIDRRDLSDVIVRYANGVDTCDWELFRSCFADTIELDFAESHGNTPPQTMEADKWVEFCKSVVPGFDATEHVMSNITYSIRGDSATLKVTLYANHTLVNSSGINHHVVGGYYTHQLKRTARGWKIIKAKLTQTWTEGPRELFDMAAARVKNGTAPRMKRP